MSSITPILRDYKSKDGRQQIVIRVEHNARHRLIPVGHKVAAKVWTGDKVGKHSDAAIINSAIAHKVAEIRRYFAECELRGLPVRLDLIGSGKISYSFTEYLDHRALQYKEKKNIVMRQKVERFAKELRLCFARQEVLFEEMTPDSLRDLENWLIDQGNVNNTRHKKFKFLGEFYTHAMNEDKAQKPNPFKGHYIATKPVKKEKLTTAEIKTIEDLQLQEGAVNDARNLFLFSYYVKGSRFENCIQLRRRDIRDGRVHVQMNKGGKYISVRLHSRLQKILDQYSGADFVFPYVTEEIADPGQYKKIIGSRNTVVNRNLKVVATLADITKPLTFHISRHSFADQLGKVTKTITVIKEALGHSEERTTRLYMNALGDERLDEDMEKLYGV